MMTKSLHAFVVFSLVLAIILALSVAIIAPASMCVVAESQQQRAISYFGNTVTCGKDNGYIPNTSSGWNPLTLFTLPGLIMGLIPDGNPHAGWSLGSFYVEGFSGQTTSSANVYDHKMPVFLKNAGDTVEFGFKLDQNINKLNGNSSLSIADDHKVIQGCWIEDPYIEGDFGKGVLVIVHTDSQGVEKTITYRDFLNGKSVGANTTVQLFEEGDYRVILCYEIYRNTGWNFITDWMDPNGSWFDYRMEAYFSVRNGNAMVYPFDLGGKGELSDKSCTEDGFRVDLANSKYLNLSVKREILNSTATGIIEDVRFNKVVADGAEFTEEGKYTITATNIYTGLSTTKTICVGTNDILRCNTTTGRSVDEIASMLKKGYVIHEDGSLSRDNVVVEPTPITPTVDIVAPKPTAHSFDGWMISTIVFGGLIVVAGVVFLIKRFA